MSYNYTDGDGLSALDKTEPAGSEAASNLDDAVRQIKAYLKDATGGLAAEIAKITTLQSEVAALESSMADLVAGYTNAAGVNAALDAVIADAADLDVAVPVTNNRGAFLAYKTASQTVAHDAGEVAVPFPAESFDPDNAYDIANSKYVAPVTGVYQFNLQIRISCSSISSPTNIQHQLKLKRGGTIVAVTEHDVGADTDGRTYSLTTQLQLTAGNEISVFYQPAVSSGTVNFNLVHDNNKTIFQGFRIV